MQCVSTAAGPNEHTTQASTARGGEAPPAAQAHVTRSAESSSHTKALHSSHTKALHSPTTTLGTRCCHHTLPTTRLTALLHGCRCWLAGGLLVEPNSRKGLQTNERTKKPTTPPTCCVARRRRGGQQQTPGTRCLPLPPIQRRAPSTVPSLKSCNYPRPPHRHTHTSAAHTRAVRRPPRHCCCSSWDCTALHTATCHLLLLLLQFDNS